MVPIEKHFKFEKEIKRPKSKTQPPEFVEPGSKPAVKPSKLKAMSNHINSLIKRNRERTILEHAPVDPSRFYRERQEALAKQEEEENADGKKKKKKKDKPTGLDFKYECDDDDDEYNKPEKEGADEESEYSSENDSDMSEHAKGLKK